MKQLIKVSFRKLKVTAHKIIYTKKPVGIQAFLLYKIQTNLSCVGNNMRKGIEKATTVICSGYYSVMHQL